jgi:hypothetical protein
MLHPLLHLVATQPQLLAAHAEAYAELVAAEIGTVSALWKRRALLNAVGLCCLGVAAVLAGVALMLWAVIPAADIQAPWALVAAPLLPVAVAVVCLMAARARGDASGFDKLRQQVKADIMMLREVSAA